MVSDATQALSVQRNRTNEDSTELGLHLQSSVSMWHIFCCRREVAQNEASLQLRKAEAVTKAVQATRQRLVPIFEQQQKDAAARQEEEEKAKASYMLCYVELCHVALGYVMLSLLRHAVLCCAMLCSAVAECAMLHQE